MPVWACQASLWTSLSYFHVIETWVMHEQRNMGCIQLAILMCLQKRDVGCITSDVHLIAKAGQLLVVLTMYTAFERLSVMAGWQ